MKQQQQLQENFLTDPTMQFATIALQPEIAEQSLQEILPKDGRFASLNGIEVVRHKPGKRALIAYSFGETETVVLAKIRGKGLDWRTHELQQQLFAHGFSVPQPLGTIAKWHMTLQAKAAGQMLTHNLSVANMRSLAKSLHQLHNSKIVVSRQHNPNTEMQILQQQLAVVIATHPEWGSTIMSLLAASEKLLAVIAKAPQALIHRDCYPDQFLINKENICMLDLDLCCMADPALDIGNFMAHLSELALRTTGQANAFEHYETALLNQYVECSGVQATPRILAYKTLSLLRHIAISQRILERKHLTEQLMSLCEQQLGLQKPLGRTRLKLQEVVV